MTPLRQRMTEDMQVRNLALNTQVSYAREVSLVARISTKSPELLGSGGHTRLPGLLNQRKETGAEHLCVVRTGSDVVRTGSELIKP